MIQLADWNESAASGHGFPNPKPGPLQMITAQTVRRYPPFRSGGLSLRVPQDGPECSLVMEYMESFLPRPRRGHSLTVFIEPEIESGFPDVVAVYWHLRTAMRWPLARADLKRADFCVAHFLATAGPSDMGRLTTFFPATPGNSLERLHAAGVVRRAAGVWSLRPLRDVFAVRRLVAIEAKIANWQKGLDQATQNTWFASESYLLLPRVPRGSALLAEAARLGVGVRVRDQSLDGPGPVRREDVPRSYASWLFNEWAWRAALRL
jgi:hypothetical protein